MMQGMERDYRKASRRSRYKVRCAICGEEIVGKAFRVSDSPLKFGCNRCANERYGV